MLFLLCNVLLSYELFFKRIQTEGYSLKTHVHIVEYRKKEIYFQDWKKNLHLYGR